MSDDALVTLIQRHLRRYPESDFHDVYKLLHQAAFGPGHLIRDKKKALEWIERDLEGDGPDAGEPLIEFIHPTGAMVRLHLRPYLAHGGDLRRLRDALLLAAQETPGDPEAMARWWEVFCGWAEKALLGRFDVRELRLFAAARAAENWPATHHSPAYHAAYRPAYRVLTAGQAEALCEGQGIPLAAV
jgi:hypothetical protein